MEFSFLIIEFLIPLFYLFTFIYEELFAQISITQLVDCVLFYNQVDIECLSAVTDVSILLI